MRRSAAETTSFWHLQKADPPLFPALQDNISCDVCVIGAGISGLSVAYFLQKQGRSVVVVDAWNLGAGETCRTTAHITSAFDDGYYALEKLFRPADIKLFAQGHIAA